MAYKCRICGSNDVAHPGDVCELCAIGQDPYAAAMQGDNAYSSQPQIVSQSEIGGLNTRKGAGIWCRSGADHAKHQRRFVWKRIKLFVSEFQ